MIFSRLLSSLSVFFLLVFTLFAPLKFSVPYTCNIDQSVPQDLVELLLMSWPAEWGLFLLLASAMCHSLSRWGSGKPGFQAGSLDLWVLLWVLSVLLVFLAHGMKPAGLQSCLLFLGYGLYYFLLRGPGAEAKTREMLWTVSVLSLTLIAVYGFYQHYEGLDETLKNLDKIPGSEAGNPQVLSRLMGKKVFSTFVYSNTLAGYLILWIPPLLLSWRDPARRNRFLTGGMLGGGVFFMILFGMLQKFSWAWVYALHWFTLPLSSLYLLWLTRSKGALLSLLIAGALAGFFWIFQRHQKSAWVLLLGAGLLTFGFLNTPLGQRIQASWKVRVEYNQASWAMIREHPEIGTGPGTYGVEYMHYKVPEAEEVQLAHNNFLQMASEYGLLTFIAFLGIWGTAFKNVLRLPWNPLKAGLLWALGAAFLHQGMDFDWFVPGLGFFTVFFLNECAGSQELKNIRIPYPLYKGLIVFACAILLVLALPVTRLCQGMDWQEKAVRRLEAGNLREAVLCYQNSLIVYPHSAQVWISLAELFYSSGDFDKAEAAYRKSLELIPDHAMTWWKLALCMTHQDAKTHVLRDKEVLTAFQNAIDYYPTNPEIQKHLEQYQRWLGQRGVRHESGN